MSEPNPNPLSPNPFQETDRPQPDPNLDGQKSPDPVLESGSFIHVVQNGDAETTVPMDREPESAAAPPEPSGAEYVTPLSQRRPMEMLQERPDWLPEGWRTEVRIRTSGVTAGTTDRVLSTLSVAGPPIGYMTLFWVQVPDTGFCNQPSSFCPYSLSLFFYNMTHHISLENCHKKQPFLMIDLNALPEEEQMAVDREDALDSNVKNELALAIDHESVDHETGLRKQTDILNNADGKMKSDSLVESSSRSLQLQTLNSGPEKGMVGERPQWLPNNWGFEWKLRISGATAGRVDKYYIAPSGQKLRSKKEVLHFLETGSKRKRKLKADAGTTPSENTSDRPQKINKTNIRNFSDIHFDFKSPPQSVTWVQTDDVKDEWVPAVGNTTVPESQKSEWGSVFSRVIKLDRTNSAA